MTTTRVSVQRRRRQAATVIKAPGSVYWALRDVVLAMAACTVSGVALGAMLVLLAL